MRVALSLSAVALALTGCSFERPYAPRDRSDPSTDVDGDPSQWQTDTSYRATLPVTAARVRGDIGAVTGFEATTDTIDWYGDELYTSVTLTAQDEQGRVGMIILDITNMDLRNTAPGTYEYAAQSLDAEIYVTGCSSSSSSFFDAPAEQGTITLRDNDDGTRTIDVTATLPDDVGGRSEAQATFTLE